MIVPGQAFVVVAAAVGIVGIVKVYDGLTIATTTSNAARAASVVSEGPSGDAHSVRTSDPEMTRDADAVSRSASRTTVPSIASFSAVPNTIFLIDGTDYRTETAGQSWSLIPADNNTLRFEIRPGDHAWFDSGSVDRSQIERIPRIPTGTHISVAYQFMLEPGPPNAASWFVTGQLHNEDSESGVPTSPPVAIELAGEHIRVVARYCPLGLDPSNRARNLKMLALWTDPNPIQRGQYYDVKILTNIDDTSKGFLDVWINGVRVVNYRGPLGYGYPTYWLEGLYRSADQSGIIAGNFRDLSITTGAALR